MRRTVLTAACAMLLVSSPAGAEFYKWVDQDGREFITNDREKIPAEHRTSAKPVEVRDDRVSIGQNPAAVRAKPAPREEHKDRYGRGEQYWRKRAEGLRRQVYDLEDERLALVKQEKEDASNPAKSAASKKKAASARNKKKAKIDTKLAKLKRELEVDLPEEARKADAYPGWLRE